MLELIWKSLWNMNNKWMKTMSFTYSKLFSLTLFLERLFDSLYIHMRYALSYALYHILGFPLLQQPYITVYNTNRHTVTLALLQFGASLWRALPKCFYTFAQNNFLRFALCAVRIPFGSGKRNTSSLPLFLFAVSVLPFTQRIRITRWYISTHNLNFIRATLLPWIFSYKFTHPTSVLPFSPESRKGIIDFYSCNAIHTFVMLQGFE